MNKKAYLGQSSRLVSALVFLAAGILCIILSSGMAYWLHKVISIFLLVAGFAGGISFWVKASKNKMDVTQFIWDLVLIAAGIIMLSFPVFFVALFPIFFGIYTLFNGCVHFITYLQYRRNKVKGRISNLIFAVLSLAFFLIIIFNPLEYVNVLTIAVGIYLILYAVTFLRDFIGEMRPEGIKSKIKRRIRITLPVFLSTFLPHRMLLSINKALKEEDSTDLVFDEKKVSQNPNLEVFVHVTEKGTGITGHVDLYFNGDVISYGSYDEDSQKWGAALGDGVLFKAPEKQKYIDFCIAHSKKTIFSYGMVLSQEQMQALEQEMAKIEQLLVPWQSHYERDKQAGRELDEKKYTDYASLLYIATGARLYKFSSGSFKSYFVLSTNCVKLAERLLGSSGTDILAFRGIITPGTMYEYLEGEYHKQGSNVISKKVYGDQIPRRILPPKKKEAKTK